MILRPDYIKAIEATMTNKRTLVVQRTGWGKSLVYFMCTKMFRRMNRGFTMVISHLWYLWKIGRKWLKTINSL